MAFPTILVNSATGANINSGAGPASALTNNDASFVGSVVTVPNADLSGVATDGSHVINLATSTGVKFFAITGKANSGTGSANVTVASAPAGTSSGLTYGIGGTLATVGGVSGVLFDNAGGAGDALPGWIVQLESGHTETLTDRLLVRRAGDTTDGPITLRAEPGASTMPILTWNTDDIALFILNDFFVLEGIEFRNTNASKTVSEAMRIGGSATSGVVLRHLVIDHATDNFYRGINCASFVQTIDSCIIGNTEADGVAYTSGSSQHFTLSHNRFHDCGGFGANLTNAGDTMVNLVCIENVFDSCAGGVKFTPSNNSLIRSLIKANTIYSCPLGVWVDGTNAGMGMLVENNIFDSCSSVAFYVPSVGATSLYATGMVVRNNAFHNNTADLTPSDLVTEGSLALDPQFTDAANGDFSIGTNLKAQGYPTEAL